VIVLGGAIALAVAIGIGRFVYTPILPPMASSLGLSKFTAGIIASANYAGYLAGAVMAANRHLPGTRRFWLLIGLGGSALTTIAMGLFEAEAAFLVLRFFGGVASALALIFTSAILLDVMARRQHHGFSALLFAGVGIGIAISAVLVSVLNGTGQNWQTLWLASGLLSAIGAGAAALMIPADETAPTNGPTVDEGVVERDLLRLAVAYGLFGFGYVITATFLVALVRDDPNIRELEPIVWVVFGLAAVPSVALWNKLSDYLGIRGAFALAAVVEAGGVVTSVVWQNYLGVFVASVCVGGTFMGLTALGLMRGKELAQGDTRRVLALMTTAFAIGQIIGPSFAGFAFEHLRSFTVPSLTAAVVLIVSAVLVLNR
jgi:predicted MFS family arabinose efflux permease